MSSAEDLIRYYRGEGTDDNGRTLREVQSWPDRTLESVHDFIQWMFPLLERSGANPTAPTLDETTIGVFRSSPDLQNNLRTSLIRMLEFYGFAVRYCPELSILRGPNFSNRSSEWISPGNHNYLRITRILKSLALLGLENEAEKFLSCLTEVYRAEGGDSQISSRTFRFWQNAIATNE